MFFQNETPHLCKKIGVMRFLPIEDVVSKSHIRAHSRMKRKNAAKNQSHRITHTHVPVDIPESFR